MLHLIEQLSELEEKKKRETYHLLLFLESLMRARRPRGARTR